MAKRSTIAVALILIAVFFVLGLLNVLLHDSQDSSETSPPPSQAPQTQPSSSQASDADTTIVLIIGVDEVNSTHPQLQSLWVAALINRNEYITLHGLSIGIQPRHENGATFSELFDASPETGPSSQFLDAVQRTTHLEPDLIIVLDAEGFAKGIDYVGGVEVDGTTIDGQRVLAFLDGYAANHDLALDAQAGILEAILPNVAALRQPIELTPLTSLVPEHAHLSTDITTAAAMLVPSLPIQAESVFLILTHSTDP